MFDQVIQFSLKHRMVITALAAFIAVYGAILFTKIPIDVFPDLNRPTVTIMTEAPGLAPEEVETFVSFPLETVLNGLPGVQRVRSSSGIGLSVIYVEFHWGTDIYRNRQLVAEKLALAKEKLPKNVTPVMGPIASIMGEIMLIGLSSPNDSISPINLRTIAEWTIRPQLLTIPGIAQVISIGGGLKQYQILISAEKLKKFQLSIEDVENKLSLMSKNTTGGFIDLAHKEYLIRNIGAVRTTEDIKNSVVGLHFGRPVLVKDIAEVQEGFRVKRGDGSMMGKPAVILSVQKQPGASTIDLTKNVENLLSSLKKTLPSGVELNANLFKQSRFIETSIQNVKEAIRDGVILVFIVLILFLMNFRTTAITLTAIPLSFLVTVVIFHLLGFSINTMTLGGLAVAIGELVDDAIVDVENVFRRLRENAHLAKPLHPFRIIYLASSEVRNSIVFATIIVVLVFIPLFYLSGIEGRLFVPLGVAYIISILASLVVSLTVTPALCSFLLTKRKLVEKEDGKLVQWLKKWDRSLLEKTLHRPKIVLTTVAVLFLAALVILPFFGREFLPKFNEGTAVVNVLAKPGISLQQSNEIGTLAEKLILESPEVTAVSRRTGRAELDEHAEGVHYSEIDVDFKEDGRLREVVFEEIRQKLSSMEGVSVSVGQPISHRLDHLLSGVRAQIAIKIFGPNLSILRSKAQEIYKALEGTRGLVDLQVEQQTLIPQVKIQLLRDEAFKFGISLGDLAALLEKALNGEIVGQLIDNQKIFDIFMRFDESSRANLHLIQATTVKLMPNGTRIKVSDVADVYEATGPNLINRENTQRRIVISANAAKRDLGSLIQEIQGKISEQIEIPEGYLVQYGGQFESQQEASRLIILLGMVSLLGIFLVLHAHFRSHFVVIQIMLNIPMALIGSVIAITITNRILSVASLVAFITLCGIASRNGIMMISHYLHLMKHEGENFSKDMVIRGSLERLIPVLMTALTAALALIPLALAGGEAGKEILQPLAVVILGGLVSSTLLDIFVTPTIFYNYGKHSAEKILKDSHIHFEQTQERRSV